jgi:serine/threonine protein kinase
MAFGVGSRFGGFEVTGLLGAGGMGEVYRARDSRLRRDVALKILPAAVATDAARLERLEREARILASLNHANIATIHAIEEVDGVRAIVMEMVEGETLAQRIAGGPDRPWSLDDTLDAARQIVDALAAAHEKGVLHRDLKPANIKITPAGVVKLLDFGLAKTTGNATGGELTHAATGTDLATEPGVLLGTVAYMSPEQARGQLVDQRTDIWAFGCVLYEMLTGLPAFWRATRSDSIAAVLGKEPAWEALPQTTPEPIRRLLKRCLSKDLRRRLHDIADARLDLEDAQAQPATQLTLTAPVGRKRHLLVVATAVLLALGAASFAYLAGRGSLRSQTEERLSSPLFTRLTFRQGFVWAARFAPDDRTIVYSASYDGGPPQVFVTSPMTPESRPLGLPPADLLAMSPSGELALSLSPRISRNLYDRRGTLARVPLTGLGPREIMRDVQFADWAPQGDALAVVRFTDGDPDQGTLEYPAGKPLQQGSLWNPRISPSGDHVAFFRNTLDGAGLAVVDRSGIRTDLAGGNWPDPAGLAWTPDGAEIWFGAAELGQTPSIHAINLDGRQRLIARGPAMLELHDLARDGRALVTRLDQRLIVEGLSPDHAVRQDFSWLDRSRLVDVSADGRTLLISEEGDGGGPARSVYLRRLDGSAAVRLGEGRALSLSPDGRWAAVRSLKIPHRLWLYPTGPGEPTQLSTGKLDVIAAVNWFPDSRRLLIDGQQAGQQARLYTLALSGNEGPRQETPEGFGGGIVSPDGKRIAAISGNKIVLWPTGGPQSQAVNGVQSNDVLSEWTADGRGLYVYQFEDLRTRIFRIDLDTGRRTLWSEFEPLNRAGVSGIQSLHIARDAPESFFYTYFQTLHELYLVDGLK